jgi:hypothetical protein
MRSSWGNGVEGRGKRDGVSREERRAGECGKEREGWKEELEEVMREREI